MNRPRTPKRLAVAALSSLALLAGGCSEGGQTKTVTNPDQLEGISTATLALASSCGEAETFFRNAAIAQMELDLAETKRCFLGEGGCYRWLADAEAGGNVPSANDGAKDDAVPDDYSETNVQVAGVDEADFVKTNGTHVYALFGRDLAVIKSWPAAETELVGRIRLKGWPSDFFLYEDKAVVISWASAYDFVPEAEQAAAQAEYNHRLWRGATLVTIVDLADPAHPAIEIEHFIDGYAMSTRRIGSKVYLAQSVYNWIDGVNSWPNDLAYDAPADEVEAAFEALRQHNIALINAAPISDWLPNRYLLQADGTLDPSSAAPATPCDAIYSPSVYSGQNLLSVITLDLDETDPNAAITGSSIIGDWGNVYASAESLYIGATNWGYYWWWQDSADAPPLATHIHEFAFGADGVARYVASGSVLGYAINQFAFDAYDGHLRVATTDGFGWWNTGTTTESRVTVLERQGAQLVQTGLLTGLGKGEQIYAVRFVGPEGYVVTFRQVDPLYTLDLADPTDPRVMAELKIPGFSSYIHPMDADHLLTIGRDANEEGQVQGLQFQIFDVTDPTQPVASHKTVIGDSWSTWSDAQWDHHSFVYYASRGLLAVPVSGWEPNDAEGYWNYRSEVFIFKVGLESGIELMGSVSHMPLLAEMGVNTTCQSWYGWGEAYMRRGLFIEDYLVSLSNLGYRVHDTRDLAAGAVAEGLCISAEDFNGGNGYSDPCNLYPEVDGGDEKEEEPSEG